MKTWRQKPPIVLAKAKKWLNQEVSECKQEFEEQRKVSLEWKGFPHYCTVEGKLECAETLLRKIDEWENKE